MPEGKEEQKEDEVSQVEVKEESKDIGKTKSQEPETSSEESSKEERDEDIDIAKATEVSREYIKDNVGNLNFHQFRIDSVRQNGDQTKYIVICSIIPDIGENREYYLIKIDVRDGKIVPPIGRGNKIDGRLDLEEIKVDPQWTE